jgi:hypothetical protein
MPMTSSRPASLFAGYPRAEGAEKGMVAAAVCMMRLAQWRVEAFEVEEEQGEVS